MKKLLLWSLVVIASISIVFTFSLAGCKEEIPEETEQVEEEAAEEAVGEIEQAEEEIAEEVESIGTISLIWLTLQAPYIAAHTPVFEEIAESLGAEVIVVDSNEDAQLQSTQIDDAIAMGVDIISLCPVEPLALVPAIKKAHEAGVAVMIMNSGLTDEAEPYIVGYSGIGNYEQGMAAIEILGESINNEGNIVIVEGLSGYGVCVDYQSAVDDFLEREGVDINLLDKQPTDWSTAKATEVMEDFIVRYGDEIDGIWAHDDYLASGVIVALQEAGFEPGDIKVVGVGGTAETLEFIKEGWMTGSVLQSPIEEATWQAQRCVEYLKTGELDPFYGVLANPKITIENVDEFNSEF